MAPFLISVIFSLKEFEFAVNSSFIFYFGLVGTFWPQLKTSVAKTEFIVLLVFSLLFTFALSISLPKSQRTALLQCKLLAV